MTIFKRFSRICAATTLGTTLVACGGAGSSGVVFPTVPDVQSTPFPVSQATASAVIDEYLDADGRVLPSVTVLDSARIPTTGKATLEGYLTGAVGGRGLVSSFAVIADFEDFTLAATAGAFQRSDGVDLRGQLTGLGTITRDMTTPAPQLQMTLTGDIDGTKTALLLDGVFLTSGSANTIKGIAGQAEGSIGTDVFVDGKFATE